MYVAYRVGAGRIAIDPQHGSGSDYVRFRLRHEVFDRKDGIGARLHLVDEDQRSAFFDSEGEIPGAYPSDDGFR